MNTSFALWQNFRHAFPNQNVGHSKAYSQSLGRQIRPHLVLSLHASSLFQQIFLKYCSLSHSLECFCLRNISNTFLVASQVGNQKGKVSMLFGREVIGDSNKIMCSPSDRSELQRVGLIFVFSILFTKALLKPRTVIGMYQAFNKFLLSK